MRSGFNILCNNYLDKLQARSWTPISNSQIYTLVDENSFNYSTMWISLFIIGWCKKSKWEGWFGLTNQIHGRLWSVAWNSKHINHLMLLELCILVTFFYSFQLLTNFKLLLSFPKPFWTPFRLQYLIPKKVYILFICVIPRILMVR